jgi:hypothetical protein
VDDPTLCNQAGCEMPAIFRYTWPGKDESRACFFCAARLTTVAGAIGLHLQLVRLGPEDYLRAEAPEPGPADERGAAE